jgi:putative transcriptional regulator
MARAPTKPPAGRTPARRTPRGAKAAGATPTGAGTAGRAGLAAKAPGGALKGEGWLTGQLLVAMPNMQDPRFARSVICLCAHSDDGAMGIVLNKPLDRLTFDDLLKQLDLDPIPPQRRIRLMAGGPVENGRGFVLHTSDYFTEDSSLPVSESIALTATVDILRAMAQGEGPQRAVLGLACRAGTRH